MKIQFSFHSDFLLYGAPALMAFSHMPSARRYRLHFQHCGVVDIMTRELITFHGDDGSECKRVPLDDAAECGEVTRDIVEETEDRRNEMIEALADPR